MKRYSKEQYRKWGKEGGSELLKPSVIRAYRNGTLKANGKVVKPPEKHKKKSKQGDKMKKKERKSPKRVAAGKKAARTMKRKYGKDMRKG